MSFFGKKILSNLSYSGVIKKDEPRELLKFFKMIKSLNINKVKIKDSKNFKSDSARFKFIRSYLGDDVEFRVDENGAWSLNETIKRIEFYQNYGVYIFEQPMASTLKKEYPLLLERIEKINHIIVDESVCTYDDSIWFIKYNAANGINLKISKHGGIINTLLIHHLSTENGFKNQIGCHVGETSILTSAGLVFSCLTKNLMAHEGAYGNFFLKFDLVNSPIQFGQYGHLNLDILNNQVGFGIKVDSVLLQTASMNLYQC